MATKTVPESVPALDPIDRLISRGVKVRQLVQLSATAAEWLVTHQDDTFRLCYFDPAGAVVSEDVTAVSLIQRAEQLGWTPDAEKSSAPHPYLFEEPVYHCRRGVHYYATAIEEETGDCLPLCFPAAAIAAAQAREERRVARIARDQELRLRREEREKKRQDRVKARESFRSMTAFYMEMAERKGAPISRAKAEQAVRDDMDGLLVIMNRARVATTPPDAGVSA